LTNNLTYSHPFLIIRNYEQQVVETIFWEMNLDNLIEYLSTDTVRMREDKYIIIKQGKKENIADV
jgi:hypothetical protein